MTIWDLELIMRLLVAGAQPWLTVLMVQGQHNWLIAQPFSLYLCMVEIIIIFSLVVFGFSDGNCRLFSCGTSKDGDSFIVEWNESEGAVKRTYHGFRKQSWGVVQFDTTKNRFLAAGDDFSIKFWDMDSVQLLTTIDADGGLPVSSLYASKL